MSPLTHGTLTGYTYGCRCPECREANTQYVREYRRGERRRTHPVERIDRDRLSDLLNEIFPTGLTSDSPLGRAAAQARRSRKHA